jgi:dTDP-4-amino-4,6-dideoxygalactose transaminase
MIPFSPPFIDEAITSAVVDALNSGWITTGPKTKVFEKKLEEYCTVEKVLALNSWTSAAELILRWFGIKEGDEVIVPAYTYCATANIVVHCGAKPVMVDVNEDFCINTDKLILAITENTKAIISVDIGGFPADYDMIWNAIETQRSIFKPTNETQRKLGRLLFLSDAAHSFGALYKGNRIGIQADFTVFSFHAVKNLTTAEGGAICINMPNSFNNLEIYNEFNIWSLHGQTKDALAKSQKGAWEYDVITAGYKCNMTDVLASIGLVELSRYESNLKRRKAIFQYYTSCFSNFEWAIIPQFLSEDKESSYHLFLLRIKGASITERNQIIQKIFDSEVSVNVHYKPLPLLSFYKDIGYEINEYPVTKSLWENEITLPVHLNLTDEDLDTVVEVVIGAVESIIK